MKIGRKFFLGLLFLVLLSTPLFSETIPYDPSLALANIVPPGKLDILKNIGAENQKIDSQEEKLNMLILTERSLTMTRSELLDMGITDTKALDDQLAKVRDQIKDAAIQLADTRMKGYTAIAALHEQLGSQVSSSFESPVDYNRTQIKSMPLSADSIKFNAQYFSYGENEEKSASALVAIKSFVSAETSALGSKASFEATAAVSSQVSSQLQNYNVAGTLVITGNCTHKNAVVLAPFFLDVDKAISVWNQMYPDNKLKPEDESYMKKLAEGLTPNDDKVMTILSGATYGSSFVGMVHLIKETDTRSTQATISLAAGEQGKMVAGQLLKSYKGGFGVDETFASDFKSLLSSTSISSHITMYCMGLIPTITSSEIKTAVKGYTDFDPAAMMEKLATLANSTNSAQSSVQDSAAAARTGGQMMAIRDSEIKSVMSGLQDVDDERNKVLDINSLMTAFEDYAKQASEGSIGVPLTYYLKPLTAADLAQMWAAKYYPEYGAVAGADDSQTTKK